MDRPTLKEVVERHREDIMKIPGVVGIGAGVSPRDQSTRCILVYTAKRSWPGELPRELDGYPVEIVKIKKGFRPL